MLAGAIALPSGAKGPAHALAAVASRIAVRLSKAGAACANHAAGTGLAILCGLAPILASTSATSARAESLSVATQNMRLAMEICLRNYPNPPAMPQAFGQAGFSLTQVDNDYWEFQAPGIFGGFVARRDNASCHVQSGDVPLRIAEEMGQRLSEKLFPGKVALGPPEQNVNQHVAPCGGFHIFAPRTLLVISYSAAGNSGACLNDGTSAVQIKM